MTAVALAPVAQHDFRLPRVRTFPTDARRHQELCLWAMDLVWEAGLRLDPWEEYVLQHSLSLSPDGTWGAIEVGLCAPRQNGKGSVLEAREIVALFIDQDRFPQVASRLVVHSAHEAKTAHEGFLRLTDLIEGTPRLRAQLRGKPRASEGGEVIELLDGRRIRFRTRTSGGGRGLSGDLLIFDEAMIIAERMHAAVWSIVTARPNPQIWYTGSAVDQGTMDQGRVFARVRKRGTAGDPDLMYVEWSLDHDHPDDVPPEVAADPEAWALANPGLDVRLSRRVIAVEQRTLSRRAFATERLGVGSWPDPDGEARVIDRAKWLGPCCDPESRMTDPVAIAFDVTPDRSYACVAAAGWRDDGRLHVEVIERQRGTGWVGGVLKRVSEKNRPIAIACYGAAAGALLPTLEREHGLRVAEKGRPNGRVVPMTGHQLARGTGVIFDAVEQETIRHRGDPRLDVAVEGAMKRKVGDAFTWDKQNSTADISPLITVTLAAEALLENRPRTSEILSAADLLGGDDEDEPVPETDLPPLDEEDE